MPRPSPLTAEDHLCLGQVAERLQHVSSEVQFQACMDSTMQRLIPHEMLLCAVGRLREGNVVDAWLHSSRLPAEFVKKLVQPDGGLQWPWMQRWSHDRSPALAGAGSPIGLWPAVWSGANERERLGNLAAHAYFEMSGVFVSCFCFARVGGTLGPRHDLILRLLVPHLHLALVQVREGMLSDERARRTPALNERQQQILHWLRLGKTNTEIALILQTSESNVKYHLREMFRKLGVINRTHAATHASACANYRR